MRPFTLTSLAALTALLLCAGTCTAEPAATLSDAVEPHAILSAMERVADWQLANPSTHAATDWTQGVGDTGMMALAGISGDRKYRDAMVKMGEDNSWKLGPYTYFADDQTVGQTYEELYMQLRQPKMLAALRAQFDFILANPHEGNLVHVPKADRWTWCDALFMAPPAWLRLHALTGDKRYLDFAVNNWWRTSDYLYDKDEHLFYRDNTFFDKREANGQKVFWSRGNGWVMAGLVRVLQYLPVDHPERARFERQFKDMATRLVGLQQADGLWHASLLDPASFPLKETSGSSLNAYAFAWGVNQGLLDRATFEPSVRKAWSALIASVQADGKLTHVQPIGHDPKSFDEGATEVYGVGGFLLAGSEIYRMAATSGVKPQIVVVANPANLQRIDEVVEVAFDAAAAPARSYAPVVMDAMTSRILDTQLFEGKLLFQVNLLPHETRRYLLLPAQQLAAVPPPDVKTAARFVPERLDDFAWENDRIAHRIYGPAILKDPKQTVSSGVDVWVKSVRYPIADKWYKARNYHVDHGEGLDNYDVGTTRGCGGISIVDGKTMYNSSVFKNWKLLASGPLRASFELSYDSWDAGKRKVSETRRITLDAGSNFSRVDSVFSSSKATPLQVGIGIAQRKGEGRLLQDESGAALSYWEPEMPPNGSIACAVLVPTEAWSGYGAGDGSYFAFGKAVPGKSFLYFLGAGWSKSGDFPTAESWEAYVRNFSLSLKFPLAVTVENGKRD